MLAVRSQAPLCLHSPRYNPMAGERRISSVSMTQTTAHNYATFLSVSNSWLLPYWESSLRCVTLTYARLGASYMLLIRPVPWGASFSFLIFKIARGRLQNGSSERPPEWWRRKNGFIVIYLLPSAIFMMLCHGKCPVCVRYLAPLILSSLDTWVNNYLLANLRLIQ